MQVPNVAPPQPLVMPRTNSFSAKAFQLAAGLSLVITLVSIGVLPFLQPVIPIFYTLAQPEKQLAAKSWLLLFPLAAWLITLLHFSLLKAMKDLDRGMQKIFCWATVGLVSIIGLLLIRLILLVI